LNSKTTRRVIVSLRHGPRRMRMLRRTVNETPSQVSIDGFAL
jgi:hypothetical protein